MRATRRPAAVATMLALLTACTSTSSGSASGLAARSVAGRWVTALNRGDVSTVTRLACVDDGFRASEVETAQSGTHLGPYTYHYYLHGFRMLSGDQARVVIVQRLIDAAHGRHRVSDLPGTFMVLRRASSWQVCRAGAR